MMGAQTMRVLPMQNQAPQATEQDGLAPAFRAQFEMFTPLSPAEARLLSDLFARRIRLEAHATPVAEGTVTGTVYLIETGWAIRYKLLSDGRRQIVNFLLPGDLVGVRASLFGVQDETVETLTPTSVAIVPFARILELFRSHPKIAAAINWLSAREEAMMADHITRLGRRNAYERMSHLLLELLRRLRAVGLTAGEEFDLPATQETLGDFLGLSVVHVNRTLRRLREEGLIAQDAGRIQLLDIPRLEAIADFESPHLDRQLTPPRTQSRLAKLDPESPPRASAPLARAS